MLLGLAAIALLFVGVVSSLFLREEVILCLKRTGHYAEFVDWGVYLPTDRLPFQVMLRMRGRVHGADWWLIVAYFTSSLIVCAAMLAIPFLVR
ncbi:hypothetical protein LVB87_10070 [Lysobacter sp. KIS68-7]|uniref:hypothetical protein n=1 Tax=Lysobacter sp. KIS68-7 TaxID=2904252 RepID=UPI001E62F27B|nr:hypothetical protein [Lysobacter sp. KIS68-7]UHQ18553.1 hypothetical protein LVB87_10070 [Lysobacter sp. KIS68-7]